MRMGRLAAIKRPEIYIGLNDERKLAIERLALRSHVI